MSARSEEISDHNGAVTVRPPLLECREVSIRFGGVQALADVSLKVAEWEIVGLIGPNGAGKTTLFNCITGFYKNDTGSVAYKGGNITNLPIHERAALGLGRTFQTVGLVKSMTVLENLMLAQHLEVGYSALSGIAGSSGSLTEERNLEQRALNVLDFMGLVHLQDEKLPGMPYGTLKMVEVAAVLATDPEILLLDEPSAGVGPEESEKFGDRLLGMRKELGLTIVMIEHHVPLVVRVCDYIYVLNFGQLLVEGKPEYVRSHPEVVTAYLGADD